MAEDGNCQFNSIVGTVFNDSSTKAGHMPRRLLCTCVENNVTHELKGMLPTHSTKEELLARIGKYEPRVGPDHHGDEDTLMVCAPALGVGFLVVKVDNRFEDPQNLCEPGGFSGVRFALLFDSTIRHGSDTATSGHRGRDVDALYFFDGHFLSNAHRRHIDCRDLHGDDTVTCTLFSVDAAFNYTKAQFFGD